MFRMIRLISIRPITVPPEDCAKWTLERMHTEWSNLNQTDLWMMKKGGCSRKKMESLGRSPCPCLCSRHRSKSRDNDLGLHTGTVSSMQGVLMHDAPSCDPFEHWVCPFCNEHGKIFLKTQVSFFLLFADLSRSWKVWFSPKTVPLCLAMHGLNSWIDPKWQITLARTANPLPNEED